jgi:hypothetical protein
MRERSEQRSTVPLRVAEKEPVMSSPSNITSAPLVTTPNLEAPDDFYEALIEAHQGFNTEQSHALNARLVLVLANHIGSMAVLRQALTTARQA